MRRFTITPERIVDGRVVFDRDESRHLARVLRLGPGNTVVATDGAGGAFTVRVETVGELATGTVIGGAASSAESPCRITLAQSVPKGDKMDQIVRAVTELGVVAVAPLITERTIVRLEPARWRERARRWQRIAREAAKQCGRAVVPLVEVPRPLGEFLELDAPTELRLCLWEGAAAEHSGDDGQASLSAGLPGALPASARVTLLVGPEGGLGRAEVAAARCKGFVVVGLGPRILRSETAGPAVVAILQARLGDLR